MKYKKELSRKELALLKKYNKALDKISKLNMEMLEIAGVKGFQASTDSTVKIWNKLHAVAARLEQQIHKAYERNSATTEDA